MHKEPVEFAVFLPLDNPPRWVYNSSRDRERQGGRKVNTRTVTTANKLMKGNKFHFMYTTDDTFFTHTVKSVRKLHSGRVVRVDYIDDDNVSGYCEMPSQEPVYIYR